MENSKKKDLKYTKNIYQKYIVKTRTKIYLFYN